MSGFDHVAKVRDAMSGVPFTIDGLKQLLADSRLADDIRRSAEWTLDRGSRAPDAAETAFRP